LACYYASLVFDGSEGGLFRGSVACQYAGVNFKAALFATAAAGAFLLVAACGGDSSDSNDSSVSRGTASGSSGSGICQAQAPMVGAVPVVAVQGILSSFDAPMLYLAEPGPVTATLLATPAPDPQSAFTTNIGWLEAGQFHGILLGITNNSSVGTIVTTASIPPQPAGIPLVIGAHVNSGQALFGSEITTGWTLGNQLRCCDGFENWPAQVTFGSHNTAIVSFGGSSYDLPRSWNNFPLRIAFTNVTSDPRSGGECTAR
jgi:hypothetical protein